jgi:hypothetical protein
MQTAARSHRSYNLRLDCGSCSVLISGCGSESYPFVQVRFACKQCPREGRYGLAVLAERLGADANTADVLAAISGSCRARTDPKRGFSCEAHLPDEPSPLPPDLPKALLPRERLKVIRGARGR